MTVAPNRGQFAPGQSGNPNGRPKGAKNAFNRDMQKMVEEAMKRAGQAAQKKRPSLKDLEPGVAYLVEQAEKRPQLFMPLVAKMMPDKINMEVAVRGEELIETLQQRRDFLAQQRGEMIDVTPEEPEE